MEKAKQTQGKEHVKKA